MMISGTETSHGGTARVTVLYGTVRYTEARDSGLDTCRPLRPAASAGFREARLSLPERAGRAAGRVPPGRATVSLAHTGGQLTS
eukprot:559375-Hanusia_phi.AAC.1